MDTQFITDKKGKKKGVVLSIGLYNKMLEYKEELDAIKAYDKAKKRNEKTIPLRQAIALRKKGLKHG